jgi:hypothetical protein
LSFLEIVMSLNQVPSLLAKPNLSIVNNNTSPNVPTIARADIRCMDLCLDLCNRVVVCTPTRMVLEAIGAASCALAITRLKEAGFEAEEHILGTTYPSYLIHVNFPATH